MPTPNQFSERDLLIRLDEKVSNGFESIRRQLADMEERADKHEVRINALEHWRSKAEGAGWATGLSGKVIASVLGLALGIAGMVAAQSVKSEKHTPPVAVQTQQR